MKKILMISLLLIILIPMVYSESCKPQFFWNEETQECEKARVVTQTINNNNLFIKGIFFILGFGITSILYSKLKLHEEIKKILKRKTK